MYGRRSEVLLGIAMNIVCGDLGVTQVTVYEVLVVVKVAVYIRVVHKKNKEL